METAAAQLRNAICSYADCALVTTATFQNLTRGNADAYDPGDDDSRSYLYSGYFWICVLGGPTMITREELEEFIEGCI